MYATRLIFPACLLLLVLSGPVMAQRPGPEFWRKVSCEPFEPRTRLEALEERQGTVVIKGFTRIVTTEVRGVRVDAVEMRELNSSNRLKGVVISLREGGDRPNENRAFIDYEEIEPLLRAIDVLSEVNESVTKLAGFEGRYRTRGDFEITVFRQTSRGTAITLLTGICEETTQAITLDELAKVKASIVEAKTRIDEIR